jgi:hypothetical protein
MDGMKEQRAGGHTDRHAPRAVQQIDRQEKQGGPEPVHGGTHSASPEWDPVYAYRIRSKRPIVHVAYDKLYPPTSVISHFAACSGLVRYLTCRIGHRTLFDDQKYYFEFSNLRVLTWTLDAACRSLMINGTLKYNAQVILSSPSCSSGKSGHGRERRARTGSHLFGSSHRPPSIHQSCVAGFLTLYKYKQQLTVTSNGVGKRGGGESKIFSGFSIMHRGAMLRSSSYHISPAELRPAVHVSGDAGMAERHKDRGLRLQGLHRDTGLAAGHKVLPRR